MMALMTVTRVTVMTTFDYAGADDADDDGSDDDDDDAVDDDAAATHHTPGASVNTWNSTQLAHMAQPVATWHNWGSTQLAHVAELALVCRPGAARNWHTSHLQMYDLIDNRVQGNWLALLGTAWLFLGSSFGKSRL